MNAWNSFTNFFNGGQPAAPNYSQVGGFSPVTGPGPYASLDSALGSPSVAAPSAAAVTDPTLLQSIFGYSNKDGFQPGWGGMALGAASSLGNAWMGMKQYGLAQDALKENKRQFNINYGAQQKMLNSQLEDRQRARVAANPGAYQSVGDYMNQNRV